MARMAQAEWRSIVTAKSSEIPTVQVSVGPCPECGHYPTQFVEGKGKESGYTQYWHIKSDFMSTGKWERDEGIEERCKSSSGT